MARIPGCPTNADEDNSRKAETNGGRELHEGDAPLPSFGHLLAQMLNNESGTSAERCAKYWEFIFGKSWRSLLKRWNVLTRLSSDEMADS